MAFSLQDWRYSQIKDLFLDNQELLDIEFENSIKNIIKILHFKYLWGACKEAKINISKYPERNYSNLFALIMHCHAKRRKNHQANFFLLHCFENALRSTIAVKIANLYNTKEDNWFLQDVNSVKKAGLKKILKIFNARKSNLESNNINTWVVFDSFYLIDLQDILESHWELFSHIFKDEKFYRDKELPSYGTKEHLITKISQIRKARNEIFHNKPTKINFKADLEILLLRLDYNLEEAIQSSDITDSITFKYINVNKEIQI